MEAKIFTVKEKEEIVARYKAGSNTNELAEEYGIHRSTINNWIRMDREGGHYKDTSTHKIYSRRNSYQYAKEKDKNMAGNWIRVTEELPPDDCVVVARVHNGALFEELIFKNIHVSYHRWEKHGCNCENCEQQDSRWYLALDGEVLSNVTHWMKLPDLPKE